MNQSTPTRKIFRYLMDTGQPQPRHKIAESTGLTIQQVNNALQKSRHLFVGYGRIPGTNKMLWAAWEE